MKESFGVVQIFFLVIILVIVFAGIMSLTMNHSNAFTVKDQLISIIEKNGGFDVTKELDNEGSGYEPLEEIVEELVTQSYRQTGKCPDTDTRDVTDPKRYWVGAYTRDGKLVVDDKVKPSFCIVKTPGNNTNGSINIYYYKVIVFYHLDLPVIGGLFQFSAIGESRALYE